ncbi:splicing factor CC1-like protein [Punctularia strigosozonata HHB-11173 SS5]|uniref:splicing factor CC1-like protein n=1 Tax=Punctularia strigosozonata (strain HHB-11173) TaxID=741275 RepID=UPI0004417D7A|nr:splicing factor CC1-like protein [Punctularia strigosozonata HHB-11173 SS5]EIN13787.1 splicing factor CC1-like protein [Punctularia strigosozonata HHB-11173 SS5]
MKPDEDVPALPADALPRSRSGSRAVSDRRELSRELDRRHDDKDRRRARDPRDEFDDPRYRRRRESPPPPRRSVPPIKRPSPTYEAPPEDYNPEEPKEDDSEARSVFVSQLAARLTARDLGYFFEDKLGEGTVMDARIVTDRLSRRSKGIGYVELKTIELVDQAINLSGTVVMGLPIKVQHTEAERNRTHAGDGSLNLPPGVSGTHGPRQLYVGSLHFNLTESDIKQVFEPFGELEFVDLHRDPMTGRSKGYCFIQYKRAEDAKMALEQMEGFELAGRTLRVNTVHEKGTVKYTQQESLEENGGNLNAASRQALMQKLARIEPARAPVETVSKPVITQTLQSKSVLLKNMFDPAEETEKDWDKDLADDVKVECENKYGMVNFIKVDKESQGEIYVKFDTVDSAKKAIEGLNGRYFGGRQVTATFIPDAFMQALQ